MIIILLYENRKKEDFETERNKYGIRAEYVDDFYDKLDNEIKIGEAKERKA